MLGHTLFLHRVVRRSRQMTLPPSVSLQAAVQDSVCVKAQGGVEKVLFCRRENTGIHILLVFEKRERRSGAQDHLKRNWICPAGNGNMTPKIHCFEASFTKY